MPEWGAIPWFGVLVAVVASQIIGFLWYGPLFGKPWRAAMGVTEEAMADRSGFGAAITVGTICSAVSAVVIAILLTLSASPDLASGCKVGLLVSLAVSSYIVITMMYEKRNQTVSMIAISNQIVTLVVMGAIIGKMW
ncbi:MAG: hypothetical protein QOG04_1895 [Actinomycetota bacterium]|jgi:hypothetical protein|nr:hypothetical protein [Actinomycetota bacterium]